MAWIEVHQSLWDHRKTMEVAEALDLPDLYAASHLIALWTWALDNAPDGVLPASHRIIAKGAKWTGEADSFVAAIVDAGFVDRHESALVIHDWEMYGGKLAAQRRANAERQKRHRERSKRDVTPDRPAGNTHVTVTSPDEVEGVTVTSPLPNAPENSREENRTDGVANATRGADAPASLPSDIPPEPPEKPRTPRQQQSDRRHARRMELFAAYCRGLELDPDGEDAQVYLERAHRELKPVQDKPAPTAADMEACTRYLTAQTWRDEPPKIPQVLGSYAGWVSKGKPIEPEPTDRASPAGQGRNDLDAWARKWGVADAPDRPDVIDVQGARR